MSCLNLTEYNIYPKCFFFEPVSLLECLALERTIGAGTAKFWQRIDDYTQIQQSLLCKEPIKKTLSRLSAFIESVDYDSVWAKSPSFDCEILKSLYAKCNVEYPIPYYKERDVRTEIADHNIENTKIVNVVYDDKKLSAHHPLYDCAIQALSVQEVYNLKFGTKNVKN